VNGEAIAALCTPPVPVQVGGGIRTIERAGALLGLGADRVSSVLPRRKRPTSSGGLPPLSRPGRARHRRAR
jgi:phosphoribosylformimino-5-aminoimidazole carboxamide ribonucleotide (ProFAR) isomerase